MPACDVFISYSHRDDDFPDGWVTHLHERLELALAARAAQVKIARDDKDIRRSEDFKGRIEELLGETQILLCVVSPAYLNSTYCATELECVLSKERAARPRLVKVVKSRVRVIQQPEPLQNLLGHKFHNDVDGLELPTVTEGGQPHSSFDGAVARLGGEILQMLEESRAPRQRVLVLSSADREEECRRISADLRYDGIDVVGADALPSARKDRKTELRRYATTSDFGLLLLGSEYSEDVERAYEILAETWQGPERRCLLGLPLVPASDARQADLVKRVGEAGEALSRRSSWAKPTDCSKRSSIGRAACPPCTSPIESRAGSARTGCARRLESGRRGYGSSIRSACSTHTAMVTARSSELRRKCGTDRSSRRMAPWF